MIKNPLIKLELENELKSDALNSKLIDLDKWSSRANVAPIFEYAASQMPIILNLLLNSLENGSFDNLPYSIQEDILNHLKKFKNSIVSHLITPFKLLETAIYHSRLLEANSEKIDFIEKTKEINQLNTKYKKLFKYADNKEGDIKAINELKLKLEDDLEHIISINNKAASKGLGINKVADDVEDKKKSIVSIEQEIENKKKEILAFASNIIANEESLTRVYSDISGNRDILEGLLAKAERLIEEAENALELKHTDGISRAYSRRLEKISKPWGKRFWLLGAFIFVIITLLFGYLLTGGAIKGLDIGYSETDNIGVIIGRIVLTFIGISGAVFCANRFVMLRNLEEDYEYKVVLTKSIYAFTEKIKEIEKGKVGDYLTQVLSELHQDPLRDRRPKRNSKDDLNLENINKALELINKIKPS